MIEMKDLKQYFDQVEDYLKTSLKEQKVALLSKSDGTILKIAPKNKKTFTLDEMQNLVNGYIEILISFSHPYENENYIVIGDEEGLLKGKPMNLLSAILKTRMVGDVLIIPHQMFE